MEPIAGSVPGVLLDKTLSSVFAILKPPCCQEMASQ
jgi:hypothetical protein